MHRTRLEREQAEEARLRASLRATRFIRSERKRARAKQAAALEAARGFSPRVPPSEYKQKVQTRIRERRVKQEQDWKHRIEYVVSHQENSIRSLHLQHLFGLDTGLYAQDEVAIQTDAHWEAPGNITKKKHEIAPNMKAKKRELAPNMKAKKREIAPNMKAKQSEIVPSNQTEQE